MPVAQELRAKLLAEAEQSARNNASVAMRWADLFSIEVPQVCKGVEGEGSREGVEGDEQGY